MDQNNDKIRIFRLKNIKVKLLTFKLLILIYVIINYLFISIFLLFNIKMKVITLCIMIYLSSSFVLQPLDRRGHLQSKGGFGGLGLNKGSFNISVNYQSITYPAKVEVNGGFVYIPSLDITNKMIRISTTSYQIEQITSDPYKNSLSISNLVFLRDGSFQFAKGLNCDLIPDYNVKALVYHGKDKSFKNQLIFSTQTTSCWAIPLKTIYQYQVLELDNRKYQFLSWDYTPYYQLSVFSIAQYENNEQLRTLSIEIQNSTAARMIDQNNILFYDGIYCRINQISINNPLTTKQFQSAIDNQLWFIALSNNQQFVYTLQPIKDVVYWSAYLYKKTEQGGFQYVLNLNNQAPGYGFGSALFMGNDKYLAIMKLKSKGNSTAQISIFSLESKRYLPDAIIQNIYYVEKSPQTSTFCVLNNGLDLVTMAITSQGKFILKLYRLNNNMFEQLHIYEVGYEEYFHNFTSLSNNSFILITDNIQDQRLIYHLQIFTIQSNKIVLTNSKKLSLKNFFGLRTFILNDIIIIGEPITYHLDYIYFYDKKLQQIKNPGLSFPPNTIVRVVIAKGDYIILQVRCQSFYSRMYQLWVWKNNIFEKIGGYPYDIDIQGRSVFEKIILLANSNQLYTDFYDQKTKDQKAVVYALDKPFVKYFGSIRSKDEKSCLKTTKINEIDNRYILATYDQTIDTIQIHQIGQKARLVQSQTIKGLKISKIKIGSDKATLVFWGKNPNAQEIIQVACLNNMSDIIFSRTFSDFKSSGQKLFDCDVTSDGKVVVTTSDKENKQLGVQFFEYDRKANQK